MDFSEVALRLEEVSGRELTFDAAALRRIETFQDVIDFFLAALR
jgi:acyl carrier protein